jgi:hypothetical protein
MIDVSDDAEIADRVHAGCSPMGDHSPVSIRAWAFRAVSLPLMVAAGEVNSPPRSGFGARMGLPSALWRPDLPDDRY